MKLAYFLVALGYLLQVAYAFAQGGGSPNIAVDIWSILLTQGPITVLLAFGLFRIDQERRGLHEGKDALLERTLKALNDANTGVQGMVNATSANNQLLIAVNTNIELLLDRVGGNNKG